jgi:muramidase (phage lysozyme)
MKPQDPKGYAADSPLWQGLPEEEQLKFPQSPASRAKRGETGKNPHPFNWLNPGSWIDQPAGGLADTEMNDAQRGFLNTIAGPESTGRYNVLNGGEEFSDLSQHPNRVGKNGRSTAAGRYQFTKATWDEYSKKLGLTDFSPKSQDRAAWALASDRYRAGSGGRDLQADTADGKHGDLIARVLNPTWSSLPGGSESQETTEAFSEALRRNQRNPGLPGPVSNALGAASQTVNNAGTAVGDWLREHARWLTSPMGGQPAPRSSGDKVSSNETHFNGPVNIYSRAEDGQGLARDFKAGVQRVAFVTPANSGLA